MGAAGTEGGRGPTGVPTAAAGLGGGRQAGPAAKPSAFAPDVTGAWGRGSLAPGVPIPGLLAPGVLAKGATPAVAGGRGEPWRRGCLAGKGEENSWDFLPVFGELHLTNLFAVPY